MWWNGAAWQPPAPPRPVDPAVAVFAHLGFFVLPIVTPLVMRLTLGSRDAFLKHHATEALNAQIWFGIVWNAVGIPMMFFFLKSDSVEAATRFSLLAALGMFILFASLGAFAVYGATRAHRGIWWRYPLTPYRFVRGARQELDSQPR